MGRVIAVTGSGVGSSCPRMSQTARGQSVLTSTVYCKCEGVATAWVQWHPPGTLTANLILEVFTCQSEFHHRLCVRQSLVYIATAAISEDFRPLVLDQMCVWWSHSGSDFRVVGLVKKLYIPWNLKAHCRVHKSQPP
jgi:hypothetical protein